MISLLLPPAVRAMLPANDGDGPLLSLTTATRLARPRVNWNCIGLLGLFLIGLVSGPWLALHYPALDIVVQMDWASRYFPEVKASIVITLLGLAVTGIVCSIVLMALIQVSPGLAYLATAGAAPFFGVEYAQVAITLPALLVALKLGIAACVAILLYQCEHKAAAVLMFLGAVFFFATDGSLMSGARPWGTFALFGLFAPIVIVAVTMFTIESVRERATISPEYSVPVISVNLVLIGSLVLFIESLLRSLARRSN